MYENRNPPEQPPCGTCRVDPLKENEEAITTFFMVQDQYIMGEGGPIAINQLAIHKAMGLLKIKPKDRLSCFNKVRKLCNWWIEQIQNKRDEAM